ncbi:MAG: GGDEF domain-containing protein [Firmicutes bacterium HGW-Firmicutes-7]|nr:MAG: GGDEF domain-containing protein [Firmicutes bacterium HGW-Firmicutes-7]
MGLKQEELIELLTGLKFIEKTYEIMRIIEPIKKKVLHYQESKIIETNLICHHFWKKDQACDNCVSLRAYTENEVFIKIEYNADKIYMVTAIPLVLSDTSIVVELIKDVSKNMLVVKKDGEIEVDVHSVITNTNNLLLKDHLTNVFNRRFIDERLQVDIINNSIKKETLSLIMADIDFFKNINDTYGHIAGDCILKEIASELVSCTREGKDWVARYGGEEFLICLPNTDKNSATEVAERMRTKIEKRVFEYDEKKIALTTSFGVHTLDFDVSSSLDTIINSVDSNLYSAKRSGRNKVISS